MVKEIKRPIPDMQKLGDSMEQTRPSRQKWMKEMRPSTADVVLKYPALAKAEMVSRNSCGFDPAAEMYVRELNNEFFYVIDSCKFVGDSVQFFCRSSFMRSSLLSLALT